MSQPPSKEQNICYCGEYGGGRHTRSARCVRPAPEPPDDYKAVSSEDRILSQQELCNAWALLHGNEAAQADIAGHMRALRAEVERLSQPPVPEQIPVAYRKFIEPQYDYTDRYRYRDAGSYGAPEGWEPLYAALPASRPTKISEPARKVTQAEVDYFFNPDGDGDPRDD